MKFFNILFSSAILVLYCNTSLGQIPKEKDWTILVYMAGDNSLSESVENDLIEMSNAVKYSNINFYVQVDASAGNKFDNCKIEYNSENRIGMGKKTFLTDELKTGEQNCLQSFIKEGLTKFTSKHYGLVFWSHGNGWRLVMENYITESKSKNNNGYKAFGTDDNPKDILYLKEIGDAVKGSGLNKKLDFIAFDACLMNMVEVWYQLKDVADFGLASASFVQPNGFDYTTMIKLLKDKKTPLDFCNSFTESITDNTTKTFALVDLKKIGSFSSDLASLQSEIWSKSPAAVEKARKSFAHTLGYDDGNYYSNSIDIQLYLQQLKKSTKDTGILLSLEKLLNNFRSVVINSRVNPTFGEMNGIGGMGIYFPRDMVAAQEDAEFSAYNKDNTYYPVDFVKEQFKWSDFINAYAKKIKK